MASLESAIPPHLQQSRTCPINTPPNYTPVYPSYCARFPPTMTHLVLAIIGAQFPSRAAFTPSSIETLKSLMTNPSSSSSPSFHETASTTDKTGSFNVALLTYFPSPTAYTAWKTSSGFSTWWASSEREHDGHGWFLEVLSPSLERFETVFSNGAAPEGAAMMQASVSGEIVEHGYWGSMRDRLGAAQRDEVGGCGWRGSSGGRGESASCGDEDHEGDSKGKSPRVRVKGKKNLCIIRSGQDWSATLPAERELYLDTMHPVLIKGMTFLRDEGAGIGCFANNLWDVVDSATYEACLDRTFGLGFFDDLAALERWSKSHQTHLDIFGGFLKYAKKLDNVLSLRLFHEVYVLEEGQQVFEYVGCHDETGMLNSLRGGEEVRWVPVNL